MSALLDEFAAGTEQEREESWRYSKNALRALVQRPFAVADAHADAAKLMTLFAGDGSRIVFVNGAISEQYSRADSVAISNANGRTKISIDRDLSSPLQLIFASMPGLSRSRWELQIEVSVNAHATILEYHIGGEGADIFGSLHSLVAIAKNANTRWITLVDLPESASLHRRFAAQIHSNASLSTTHALSGGRFQRFDIACRLAQTNSRYEGRGAFVLSGRSHIDTHLDVHHSARDTASDVSWRGIADDRSRGILHGAITVDAGADGADAKLQTKNLLLSPNAEIDAQPVLEIYADEVKASHGATVGQLDERALFYLRSRGIAVDEARSLLTSAFVREVLTSDEEFVANAMESWLSKHLKSESSR